MTFKPLRAETLYLYNKYEIEMKKLATIFFAILISATAFGQERQQRSPEERAKRQTEKLTQELGLTADQQKKVYDLTLEQSKAAKANRADGKRDREAMQNRWKEHQKEFEGILTPEQLNKHKEIRAEQMKKRRDEFKRKPAMKKRDSLHVKKNSVVN